MILHESVSHVKAKDATIINNRVEAVRKTVDKSLLLGSYLVIITTCIKEIDYHE